MKFFLSRIGIPKYLNMHKSRYKLAKKRNRCEVTIKSTITKGTIRGKKMCLKQLKKKSKERKLERERERRERIDLFCNEQLGRNMGERWK